MRSNGRSYARRKQSFRSAPRIAPPSADTARAVTAALLAWGTVRFFPWRAEQLSPFRSLIAETLLVRTRAEGVADLIPALWSRFPTPSDLARAPLEEIAQVIAPLGLGKRAQQLKDAARQIVESGGEVPEARAALLRLPGVGTYVADAVRLFAFGERVLPIDAVIGRVLRRVFGHGPYGPAYDDRALWSAMQPLTEYCDPANLASALLDLGALICVATQPRCPSCPLAGWCAYRAQLDAPRAGLTLDPAISKDTSSQMPASDEVA